MDYSLLSELRSRYKKGENIIEFIRQSEGANSNSIDAILLSYDLQAGSYTKRAESHQNDVDRYTQCIASVLDKLPASASILEAGVGEATTLSRVLRKLSYKPDSIWGFDLSWSRSAFARKNMQSLPELNSSIFVGDIFNVPLPTNSVELVYTAHSIEPNGGREEEALLELYRVTKKFLVLFEPAYDLADKDSKARMERLGYAKNIYSAVLDLGWKIVEHGLLDFSENLLNPTGFTIIEKADTASDEVPRFVCPITHAELREADGFLHDANGLLTYPILKRIPCLRPENAIVATHFQEAKELEE